MDVSLWAQLDLWGRSAFDRGLSLIWQSTILFTAVGILSWWLRRRPAIGRCRLWIAALLVTPFLPWLTDLLTQAGVPRAELGVLPHVAHDRAEQPAAGLPAPIPPRSRTKPDTAPGAETKPATATPGSLLDHPWALVALAYPSGCALLLLVLIVGHGRVAGWRRRATPVEDPRILEVFHELAGERRPELLQHPRLPTPLAVGLLRPAVLLPSGSAATWSPTELRAVLAHELSHIRRGDPLMLQLVAITRVALFFHPLVWIAARRIVGLAEQAADADAVEARVEPVSYVRLLARLAEDRRGRVPLGDVAVGIALPKSTFVERVEAILAMRRTGRRLTRTALATTVIAGIASLGVALLVPLGPQGGSIGEGLQAAEGPTNTLATRDNAPSPVVQEPQMTAGQRVLQFPEDREVGVVFVRPAGSSDLRDTSDQGGWTRHAAARGTVILAPGQIARLTLNPNVTDLSFLDRLEPDALYALSLSFAEIDDAALTPVARLTQLRQLEVVETPITDAGLAPIAALSQLRSLSVGQGQITDQGLVHLGGLEQLEVLDARSSAIRGPGLVHLEGLRRLHTLYLGSTEVDDEGILHLPRLEALEKLYLWSTSITDAALPYLAGFDGLRWLDLWSTKVTDDGLVHLRSMRNLRSLRLEGTTVGSRGLAPLSDLTSLEELYLGRTSVGDDGVAHIAALPRLRLLALSETQVGDASLALLRGVESLEFLNISGTQVDEVALEELVGHPSLKAIRVGLVGDRGLESLSRIPNLTDVRIGDFQGTVQGMRSLTQLPLTELSLAGKRLSSDVLSSLSALKGLKTLSLSSKLVGDEALGYLVGLENLQSLTLIQAQITGPGLLQLRRLDRLATLTLLSTTISARDIEEVRRTMPNWSFGIYPEPLPSKTDRGVALDWDRWRKLYRLDEGEVLKRIPPPFLPERLERYRRNDPVQAQAIPRGPDRMTYHWDGALTEWTTGFGTGDDVAWALRYALRLSRTEYEVEKELLDVELPGDWIVRPAAPKRRLLEALADLISVQVGRRVEVDTRNIERPVVVVRGSLPLAKGVPATLGRRSVQLFSDTLDETSGAGGGSGTVAELLRWVGNRTGVTFVDETDSSNDIRISWTNHRSSGRRAIASDPTRLDRLLENLEKQTGLELKKEVRVETIWRLSAR